MPISDEEERILGALASIDKSTRDTYAATENLAQVSVVQSRQLSEQWRHVKDLRDLCGALLTRCQRLEERLEATECAIALGNKRGAA